MTSSGETSPLSITPAGTPISNQAPKYGTLIPNRIFVGGIAANQNEQELKQFFSAYGAVKDCKIIADRAGVSKGYGFVTFETQEDAEKIIKKEADNLIFKDRKLNIGPAIRKQQAFPKLYEQSMTPGAVFFSNGVPYTYQNGMAVFQPSDSGYTALSAQQTQQTAAAAAYPMMMQSAGGQPATAAMYALSQHTAAGYPQTAYTSPTAAAAAGWGAQWRWTPQSPPVVSGNQYMTYPMQSPGFSHDMLYAGQGAQYPSDMTAAAADSSMIEAAQAAEGSVAMDPNMAQQPPYAEVMAPPPQLQQQPVQQTTQQQQEENNNSTPSLSSTSSSINHGKRHAAPLVVTPRKHMNHPGVPFTSTAQPNAMSNVMYSARATPPPAKVFHGHTPLTPPPTPEVQHQQGAPNPSAATA